MAMFWNIIAAPAMAASSRKQCDAQFLQVTNVSGQPAISDH
jgi:hypothetical protein